MQVEQVATLLNSVTKQVLGDEALQTNDLSNVVDIGTEIFNANAVDNYVKTLVDHIGRVIFVNRPYAGGAPSVLMDAWEFGSVLEKVQADLPEASENASWELVDGKDYSPNVFYKPSVSAKFFNSKTTFEIDLSFTEKQVKESFSNGEQLNAFMSMLYNSVEKSMTVKFDGLVMSTINNATAQVLNAKSGVQVVDLLAGFNTLTGQSLTAANALSNTDFLKYASMQISLYKDRISKMSTLFNAGGKARFTPSDRLHIVALSEFMASMDTYLQADTFHNELTKLPNGVERVAYWQGSGQNYAFDDTSKIDVTISVDGTATQVAQGGILCVMFDHDALGVCNLDRRVTTNYNPKAEFFNNFYKFDAGFFNDMNENFVVFGIGLSSGASKASAKAKV